MNTITLYKVTCTKAYQILEQGTGYSLRPWGDNTDHYEGYDDGGKLYGLPEGYTVETMQDDSTAIFDERQKHCDIVLHSNGLPGLVSSTRTVVLKLHLGLEPEKQYMNPHTGTVQTGEEWQADCDHLGADALDYTWSLEEVTP